MSKKILVADDDINIISSVKFLLCDHGYEIVGTTSIKATLEALKREQIDLLLMDMNYQRDTTSGGEGLELVNSIRQLNSEQAQTIPIIAMTGWATVDVAVEALKSGAMDFIQKPWNDERLLSAISTQLKLAESEKNIVRLKQENHLLTAQAQSNDGIIFQSEVMRILMESLENVAKSNMNILLTGENGTGKSMLVNYMHRVSTRSAFSLISSNMGAIPENLFESEMFGHVKGAYTDAKENRVGRFEMAQNGTLFLDEVGNIPMTQQAKLLRVIEERQYEPVGSSKTRHTDVRIVSATNCDLNSAIEEGRFRRDLYYRINTVELHIPALRTRQEDIPLLAVHFLSINSKKYQKPCPKISPCAIDKLCCYSWPGNLRELNHAMERLVFTHKRQLITADDLILDTPQISNSVSPDPVQDVKLTLDEIEQTVIELRLRHYAGNVGQTAKSLGLSRSGYYRRMNKFGF